MITTNFECQSAFFFLLNRKGEKGREEQRKRREERKENTLHMLRINIIHENFLFQLYYIAYWIRTETYLLL